MVIAPSSEDLSPEISQWRTLIPQVPICTGRIRGNIVQRDTRPQEWQANPLPLTERVRYELAGRSALSECCAHDRTKHQMQGGFAMHYSICPYLSTS